MIFFAHAFWAFVMVIFRWLFSIIHLTLEEEAEFISDWWKVFSKGLQHNSHMHLITVIQTTSFNQSYSSLLYVILFLGSRLSTNVLYSSSTSFTFTFPISALGQPRDIYLYYSLGGKAFPSIRYSTCFPLLPQWKKGLFLPCFLKLGHEVKPVECVSVEKGNKDEATIYIAFVHASKVVRHKFGHDRYR